MSKRAIAVIGEGITEKYYIESIRGLSDFEITPRELGRKASNLQALKKNIDSAIKQCFDEVYCLIDMDDKNSGKSKTDYLTLKQKYQKTHAIKSKGISCKVQFIETQRCTELWFLYHFIKTCTTQEFTSYKQLEKALQKYLPNYSKTEQYFKGRNLHREFLTNGGLLSKAMSHAESSIASKTSDGRDYTYSEMHLLINALKIK